MAAGKPALELRAAALAGRFEDEGWRIRKDGSRVWANVVITALRDPAGAVVGFGKGTLDLTARRAAEEARATAAGGRITVSAGTAVEPSPDAALAGDGPWVYLRVEDTGVGIPADWCEAVFEPFVQAEATAEAQREGTGLGLAISRRLARLMGGDLTVRSEVGAGSTFFLWLHAAPPEHAAARDGDPDPGGT